MLNELGYSYASVVHTQTDYGTTGYEALGKEFIKILFYHYIVVTVRNIVEVNHDLIMKLYSRNICHRPCLKKGRKNSLSVFKKIGLMINCF